MTARRYTARLRHDRGIVRVTTWAVSEAAALRLILAAEGAPQRAVISIKET